MFFLIEHSFGVTVQFHSFPSTSLAGALWVFHFVSCLFKSRSHEIAADSFTVVAEVTSIHFMAVMYTLYGVDIIH